MMMNNALHFGKAVEDELSARKSAALYEQRLHIDNIRANYPEIQTLRDELSELTLDLASKLAAAPDPDGKFEQLAKELTAKKEAEIVEKLIGNGFPPDYLGLRPRCPVCRDTGISEGQMCSCLRQIIVDSQFAGSGVDPKQSFKTFRHDLDMDPKDLRALDRIHDYCLEYAENFPDNERRDMLLMGAPGRGKTFLLNCIGGRIIENGHSVLRLTAYGLVNSLLDSIRSGAPAPDMLVPDLLMIDDLGAEPMINNVTVEALLSAICMRQEQNKAVIVATNKTPEQLAEDYGERIVSRLFSPRTSKVITMLTPSIRMMKD